MSNNESGSSFIGRTLDVFKIRPYLYFWIGAFISNMGNWTENAAQSWAVTTQTVGDPHQGMLVELLHFADFSPVILLALIAGVISDRVNKRVWLIFLQGIACLLGAGLAAAAFMGKATPWVVILFTFLEGIVWALNGPVFLAIAPNLVPREKLHRAIAMNSVQFNMARLCGPMIAAAIIAGYGIATAFTFNSLTFLPLMFILMFAIPPIPTPARPKKVSIYADIGEGLSYVWNHRGTRRLTIMGFIFMFLGAPLQGLLPIFAQSVLHGGPFMFGLMLSCIGLGSIIGAFLLSLIPEYYPRHHLIPLSMCMFGVVGVLYSFSRSPALSLLILVASGCCWMLSLNPSNTANQLLATEENRGRVLSIMLLALHGGLPLGHLFAGFLTHFMSPQWVVRLMLGTLLLIMIFLLFRREPAIDNMERRKLPPNPSWRYAIWEAITASSHRPVYTNGKDGKKTVAGESG